MMAYFSSAVIFVCFLVFARTRLLTYLHIFQQEEYDSRRFLLWVATRRAFDRKATVALLLTGFASIWADGAISSVAVAILAALALGVVALLEENPLTVGKKRLVFTARARRIFWTSGALLLVVALALFGAQAPVLAWLLPVQIVPLALAAATALLSPYENRANRRFIEEARIQLARVNPTIVGITGSFGKTSAKHILGHILGTQAPTLVTPGSVNTELGITRVVREKLKPRDRFFVCEMGAYGVGSIARLCRLTPPAIGIVTAIGHAHYERFKSLDAVAKAKFELAESVVGRGGKMIIHDSTLAFDSAREFANAHRGLMVVVGSGCDADLRVLSFRQTVNGIEVDIEWLGQGRTLKAPLFGAHHASNIALVFAAAATMGVEPGDIETALTTTPQIKHRSEVYEHPTGAVIIDDAYNSNPRGFAGGLSLLDLLQQGGRRILITPGMVELGTAHDSEHRKIGELAARHVDVLLPVLPERLESMIAAYREHAPAGQVLPQPNLQSALAWMATNLRKGDVLLLENDLPDLYEKNVRL